MKIAFVADPLDALDPSTDTTVGLMHAAQDRGAEVWVTEAPLLEAAHGRARARARRVRLAPSRPSSGHRWTVAPGWFTATEPQRVWLDEMAAVFMRTEPPLDQAYINATLILDLIDPGCTAMINDPGGLRACSEHLLPLRFPDLIPPTIVTADESAIRSFLAAHHTAVIKPVDGFSGRGVLRLDRHDPNLGSLIEISTHGGARRRRSALPARGHSGQQADISGAGQAHWRDLPIPASGRFPDRRPDGRSANHRARPRDLRTPCADTAPPRYPPGRPRRDRTPPHRSERHQRRGASESRRAAWLDALRGPVCQRARPAKEEEIGMTTAIICTAILTAMLFLLGLNVSRMRGVTEKAGGSQFPNDPTFLRSGLTATPRNIYQP